MRSHEPLKWLLPLFGDCGETTGIGAGLCRSQKIPGHDRSLPKTAFEFQRHGYRLRAL